MGTAANRCCAAILLPLLCAPLARAADLTVKVDGLTNAQGKVVLAIDDSAAAWDDKAPDLASGSVPAAVGEVSYTFKDLKPGTYAVGVFQDENNNGKLDTNFLGIPKEGFGFSNNLKAMRKATFQEASFNVGADDSTIVIHLAHIKF
jgi:uncharacterized protein (DUF2141 family)